MASANGATVLYYRHDGLSSVRALADAGGTVTDNLDSDEFGAPAAATSSPHSYVGGPGGRNETSASPGLFYMRARWFASDLGRFISADPIGFAGGLNLYAYVGNNPVRFVDPSGLQPGYPYIPPTGVKAAGDGAMIMAEKLWIRDAFVPGPYGNPDSRTWGTWNDTKAYMDQNAGLLSGTAFRFSLGAMAITGLFFLATQPQIGFAALRAAALDSGLDLTGISLRYSWRADSCGYIFRGSRTVYFSRFGLSGGALALRTLAHELHHIAEFEAGLAAEEGAAIAAEAEVAGFAANPSLIERFATWAFGPGQ